MPDHPVPLFRIQWQSRQNDPGNHYVATQHTAERIARWLKRSGHETVIWPITSWEPTEEEAAA